MADPRITEIQARSANLSDYMKKRLKASMGAKVNFCPYGCADEELDDRDYCKHLVGITKAGSLKEFEVLLPATAHSDRKVDGNRVEKVLKSDHLERITVCSWVYREAGIDSIIPPDVPAVEPTDDELESLTNPELQPAGESDGR